MNRMLVAWTMIAAPFALAVAAIAAGVSMYHPAWWSAAVHLAVLGGITMMIYAVNIRIVPVFARRTWRYPRLLVAQVGLGGVGAWLTFVGEGLQSNAWSRIGQLLALFGGLLFMVNVITLFHQKPTFQHAPPTADPQQGVVDTIATKFTRLSGMLLVIGLAIGVMLSWWMPERGRWDLVWAHTMLVGFFLTMASGVCYHVLSRWTGHPWRSVGLIRWHYRLVAFGLPLMLIALAVNSSWLFLIAGPIQALALALFAINILPLVWNLDGTIRAGVVLAMIFLAGGVSLGVMFAIDASLGARLRPVHVEANLFGWSGLLISGFGYYFAPHFAGTQLRWPRVARLQLVILALGVLGGIAALAWRMEGGGPESLVLAAQAFVGLGLLLFAVQVAGAFAIRPEEPVVLIRPTIRAPGTVRTS